MPTFIPSSKRDEKAANWYAVHTYSGYEEAVARYLRQRVESLSMEDKIFDVVVPVEKKIRVKGGRRQTVQEKIYPGYVLVKMVLDDDSWYVVRNTPRVTGFVGAESTKPVPLSKEDVEGLLARMGRDESDFTVDLSPGDLVKVTDGPFKDYDGKVIEVDKSRGNVKVLVPFLGRDTAVELDSLQVKKV